MSFAAKGASPRTFAHVTPVPPSTNVLFGVASSVTSTVTVDTTGLGASTRFGGNATITVSVAPPDPTILASVNPVVLTNFTTAAAYSTNTTLTVTTTAATPQGTYIVSIVANTNPPQPASVTPLTNTFTLNVGSVFVPQKVWSPGGINTNWSTALNWTNTGAPTPSNDVQFVDLGAVGTPGLVDNVVDTTTTIGSLTYGQTNNSHTTLIPAGVTLTIGGTANGLVTGTGTDAGDGLLVTAGITGAGGAVTFTNRNAIINIGQGHTTTGNAVSHAQATLDLSGLDTFTATPSRLLVGVDLTLKGSCGVLNLAKTNTITVTTGSLAPQIDIGDNSQSGGTPTISSILVLGQTNAIFADSIAVGRGKTDNNGGLIQFTNAFSSPTAYFRGTNGNSSRVGSWGIGDAAGGRSLYTYGACDFSSGSVNAMVDTMFVGRGATVDTGNSSNPGTGTLTFSAGSLDLNTLEVGYATTLANGTGIVNANGGSLVVNNLLELAHQAGTPSANAALNVSAATVTANNGLLVGSGTATLSITNGTLNATNSSATIGTTANPLNSFNASDATLKLAVQGIGPSVATANIFSGGTANTINISSVPVLGSLPSQLPLIQYGLNGGTANGDLAKFVVGTLPSASPAYAAHLVNNTANNSIDIVFTSGPVVPSLTWDGVPNGNWNTTTANWRPKTGPNMAYAQGDFVRFDDSLTGTPNVNLTTVLSPATLNASNTAATYVFSGVGSLSGSLTLVKDGTGALTLSETGGDNFSGGLLINNGTVILDNVNGNISGGTTISSGVLQFGNNDTKGGLPSGTVVANGTLVFARTDNITVTNPISGSGTLMQSNNSVVSISGNNVFSGSAVVAQGTLQVGGTNAFGAVTGVTVNNNATFDLNGTALFGNGNSGLVVTVSGQGVGGNGAIINNGGDQTRALHTVTMTGDTAFGGNGDWDIRNSSSSSASADAQLNGSYNLTKVGTNTVTLRGVTIDGGLGNINVQSGTITITATASAPLNSLGNGSATALILSNATLNLDTIGAIPGKNFVLTNGGTLKCSGTNTMGNQVTLLGTANNTITVGTGAQFTISQGINGGGGFSKNGSSTLFLNAANTYSGNTVVSGGTLALYGNGSDGSISSSVNLNITSGATLDASGRSDGTFTLGSGQTLTGGVGTNGPGTIDGIFVANVGSVLAPGTGNTNIGTLTVTNTATLNGSTVMKLNASTGTNDRLNAYAITYGGSLTVTNAVGTIVNGQTFQLFSSTTTYGGTFSGGVILPSAPGLTWQNNLANNGSITAQVVAAPYITSLTLTSTNLVLKGTNGTPGLQFALVTSTNLTSPRSQWTPVSTNTFTSGNFSVTNLLTPGASQSFYSLRVP
jgi:autotransporter-associated beta strand protein